MKMKKQGQFGLQNLSAAALGVVIFIITVVIGSTILTQIQATNIITVNSTAANTTTAGLEGLALFGDFTSIIVLIAIAAVILGLIAVAFRAFT